MAREQAEKEQKKSDEDLAEAIRFIQHRTVVLARCEARRLAVDVLGVPREEVDAKIPDPEREPDAPFP